MRKVRVWEHRFLPPRLGAGAVKTHTLQTLAEKIETTVHHRRHSGPDATGRCKMNFQSESTPVGSEGGGSAGVRIFLQDSGLDLEPTRSDAGTADKVESLNGYRLMFFLTHRHSSNPSVERPSNRQVFSVMADFDEKLQSLQGEEAVEGRAEGDALDAFVQEYLNNHWEDLPCDKFEALRRCMVQDKHIERGRNIDELPSSLLTDESERFKKKRKSKCVFS